MSSCCTAETPAASPATLPSHHPVPPAAAALGSLLSLPEQIHHEVLSWCPDAATANALMDTCTVLSRLRHDAGAAALAIVRHPFRDDKAACKAIESFSAARRLAVHPANFWQTWLSPPTDLVSAIMRLLSSSDDFSQNTPFGGTSRRSLQPLLQALLFKTCAWNDVASVTQLLALPSPPDVHVQGEWPLQLATMFLSCKAVQVLLAHGADPLANEGQPLRCACDSPEHSARLLPLLLDHVRRTAAARAVAPSVPRSLGASTNPWTCCCTPSELSVAPAAAADVRVDPASLDPSCSNRCCCLRALLLPEQHLALHKTMKHALGVDDAVAVALLLPLAAERAPHEWMAKAAFLDSVAALDVLARLPNTPRAAFNVSLEAACVKGRVAAASALVKYGADPNGSRIFNTTPLRAALAYHEAVPVSDQDRARVVELLLSSGAVADPYSVKRAQRSGLIEDVPLLKQLAAMVV